MLKNGGLIYDSTEDDNIRHDSIIGNLIKNNLERNYVPKIDSMIDNAMYACEMLECLVIMDDVNDMVVLFPKFPSKEQVNYYLESFKDENKRIHVVQYVGEKERYKDLLRDDLYELQENVVAFGK